MFEGHLRDEHIQREGENFRVPSLVCTVLFHLVIFSTIPLSSPLTSIVKMGDDSRLDMKRQETHSTYKSFGTMYSNVQGELRGGVTFLSFSFYSNEFLRIQMKM